MQDLPKMVPDREDIVQRRKPVPEERKVKEKTPRKPVMLWFFVLLLALLTGFVVWQNYQLTLRLNQTVDELQLSNARIGVMEGQLSATDENLVMNESNIKIQFTNHMSEIRKLWDVANKRNKGWIEDNQAEIAAMKTAAAASVKTLQAAIAQVASDASELAGTVTTHASQLTSLGKQATDLDKRQAADHGTLGQVESKVASIAVTLQQLDVMTKQISDIDKRWATLTPKFDELTLSQTLLSDQVRSMNFKQRMADVDAKFTAQQKALDAASLQSQVNIDEIRQDIASINAFRLQVNERLIGLQSQLTALEKMLVESQLSAGAQ